MRIIRPYLMVALCLPAFASCGGGGGAGEITAPPSRPPLPATLANRLVFSSNRAGYSMWTVAPDGSGLVQLGLSGTLLDVAPDGKRIAFTSTQHVAVSDMDGRNWRSLTAGITGRHIAPRWSPDGSRILFWTDRDGNPEVYVMNADGTNPVNLTKNPAEDLEATWSPDGARIAFRSQRSGGGDIYVMRADGSEVTRLTQEAGQDANPRWSPDGTRIAFDGIRNSVSDVFVIGADGTGLTNLTRGTTQDAGPTWSPDGKMIAFVSFRDGNYEVYVMNADGTGVRNVTNNPAGDSDAVWAN